MLADYAFASLLVAPGRQTIFSGPPKMVRRLRYQIVMQRESGPLNNGVMGVSKRLERGLSSGGAVTGRGARDPSTCPALESAGRCTATGETSWRS